MRQDRRTVELAISLFLAIAGARDAAAQMTARDASPPVLHAVRPTGAEPRIDGRLDDAVWMEAPVATGFTQYRPHPGASASRRTEARVLYGDGALFVGIRAFDAPDSIRAELARRDDDDWSDRVGVIIDSYHDHRTAYQFTVSPRGVKTDIRRFDDTEEDDRWDPVWDVATHTDAEGWTAEFRIPYSQLRFGTGDPQTWGIQFHRDIVRLDELSLWAPTLPDDQSVVARFGELRGLTGLHRPARAELLPYLLSRMREGATPGDPAARTSGAGFGADIKYGVTSNLTLDATVNPDFGQVEADPARVNLTAFETFYPERRPFFQEASDLFDFQISLADGDDDFETLFYSRRIGRQPQGLASGDARFASPSEQTTILGALKLSGRTSGGWSIGLLNATTARETAPTLDAADGTGTVPVEPRTNYSVTRLVRDFRDGRSALGVIATTVLREGDVADALSLHRSAFAGGADFRHRFARDRFQLEGWLLASRVAGSTAAMLATQTSPVHYFQRPDAGHLGVDSARTSLGGAAGQVRLHKIAGGPWRGGVGYNFRTPGFEIGDAGFQRSSDTRTAYVELGYERTRPQGPFRSWQLYTTHWDARSGGGERLERGGNLRGEMQLASLWGAWFGVEYNLQGLSTSLLRGGPAFMREPEVFGWSGVHSDERRRLAGSTEVFWSVRPESHSSAWRIDPTLTWRPTAVVTLRGGPFLSGQAEDRQWLGSIGGNETGYLFGRLTRTTLGATLRADLAFSPTLTLQLYAQPFVSAGAYHDFRSLADPRAPAYADRFAPFAVQRMADGSVRADLDGDGAPEAHDNPDFNYRQLRTNTVLRWEFRPGSTLYLVWSQGRQDVAADGSFRPGHDLRGLFAARSDDALMLKMSYWLNR